MATDLERICVPLEEITVDSTIYELEDAVANARGVLAKMKDVLATCKEEYESQMMAIIQARGAFQLGDTKYSIGTKRVNKQAQAGDVLNALSEATNGDFNKILDCLSTAPFKAGACKKILGKASPLFWSEDSDKLNTAVLKAVNTTFLENK